MSIKPTITVKRRRLTDLAIRHIKPPADGRLQIPDDVVTGLWLRISDTGVRSWSFVYRVKGEDRMQRITLGRWPAVGCAAAREAARRHAGNVAQDRDPARELREKRLQDENRVDQVATEFIARKYRSRGLKSTSEVEAMLRNHILPHWTGRKITGVGKADVHRVLDAISDRGYPRAANKALQLMRQLFKWAKGRGLVTADPTEGIERPHLERSRDRVLSDDELVRVWHAADKLAWPWDAYIKTLIMLGQRRSEVAAMSWRDLDLPARTWSMPAASAKMGKARLLPLPGAVVAILEAMPRLSGTDYVFGNKLTSFVKLKRKIDAASGVKNWVLHDLRRTFATGQQKIGTRLEVTEQLLGHRSGSRGGIVAVYQRHDYAAEQIVALERWADWLAQLTGGLSATVVRITR